MLRISIVEGRKQRRLVVEGKLVAPWAAELTKACEKARADLDERKLVVEVKNVAAISEAGENVLLALMNDGVKLRASGVFTKRVLKELARRARRMEQGGSR
jgi:anti-anti-sigma regulatory factor